MNNLYLIKDPKLNLHKIGISKDVSKRKQQLGSDKQIISAIACELIAARSLEGFCHLIFKAQLLWVAGEWFRLSDSEVALFNATNDLDLMRNLVPYVENHPSHYVSGMTAYFKHLYVMPADAPAAAPTEGG